MPNRRDILCKELKIYELGSAKVRALISKSQSFPFKSAGSNEYLEKKLMSWLEHWARLGSMGSNLPIPAVHLNHKTLG